MAGAIKQTRQNSRLILEELEPRRLFSGGIEGLVDSSEAQLPYPLYRDIDAQVPDKQATNDETAQAEQRSREVVFVDAGVENYQQFVDDLNNSADADRDFEVVVLDRNKDGIEQISALLQQYQNIDAVHIISHGNDGNIQLGDTSLNANTLQQNSASIALWAKAFTDSGDILIYGCDLAASEVGQNLIDELGALTLTDVAASDDLTGAESKGGDWVLEYYKGTIESTVAVSGDLQQQYGYTLNTKAQKDDYIVDEDSVLNVPATGVLANDFDTESDPISVTQMNGSSGAVGVQTLLGSGALLTLNADGSFVYDQNGSFESLGVGDSTDDSFTYQVEDDNGNTDTATVTITINGTNDAPTISNTANLVYLEAGDASAQNLSDSGTVSFDDLDANALVDISTALTSPATWNGGALDPGLKALLEAGFSASVSNAAAPGNTAWSYSVAGADLDFLGGGDSITLAFTITATDNNGATANDVVLITINGADDAAAISGDTSFEGVTGDTVAGQA